MYLMKPPFDQTVSCSTRTLTEHYPDFTIAYASKAGLNIGISNIIASEGCGVDVVSGGELFTALKSDVDPTMIYFHGNNKSKTELELAIDNNIKIIVDNEFELELIAAIASSKNVRANIMFRVKPGIEAHTHEYIKTGHIDSKFGLTFNEILPLIHQVNNHNWGEFIGIHAHIGSQIFDQQPFYDLVNILVTFIDQIKTETGQSIKELNCGGGFGIQYTDTDNAPDIPTIIIAMATELKLLCRENKFHYLNWCLNLAVLLLPMPVLHFTRLGQPKMLMVDPIMHLLMVAWPITLAQ